MHDTATVQDDPWAWENPDLQGHAQAALQDGEMVLATQMQTTAAELRCVHCGQPVFLRERARSAGFVHRQAGDGASCRAARAVRVPQSLETDWHQGAKRLLLHARACMTPAMVRGGVELCGPRWLTFDRVQAEQTVAGLRVDVLAELGEQRLGIEITVTHALDERKLRLAREAHLPLLEIVLGDLRTHPWDAISAHSVVIDGIHRKRWHLPD